MQQYIQQAISEIYPIFLIGTIIMSLGISFKEEVFIKSHVIHRLSALFAIITFWEAMQYRNDPMCWEFFVFITMTIINVLSSVLWLIWQEQSEKETSYIAPIPEKHRKIGANAVVAPGISKPAQPLQQPGTTPAKEPAVFAES